MAIEKVDDDNDMAENHTSDESLELSPDNRAVAVKSLTAIVDVCKWFADSLQQNYATKSYRYNTLSIVKSELRRLFETVGGGEDEDQQYDMKTRMLRQMSMENERLRQELASGVSISGLSKKVYEMKSTIYNWWKNMGFTYCSAELSVGPSGASFVVKFTTNVEQHISSVSPKPVTAREKMIERRAKLLKELDLVSRRGEEDLEVVDNEKNRNWLMQKVDERFPGSHVSNWESTSYLSSPGFRLYHMTAIIDFTCIGEFEKNENYD